MIKTIKGYFKYLKEQNKQKEPYFEIKGETFKKDGSVELEFDWNDAFIQYLRKNNIPGITEDEIITNYLARLFQEQSMKMLLEEQNNDPEIT